MMRRLLSPTYETSGWERKKFEEKIKRKHCHLLEEFEKFEGKPFETTRLMKLTPASSVISSMCVMDAGQVQEEIDQVIGGRQPVSEDRKNLPYTDAVIHETQRFANIAPISIPHMTSCDVHFNGYFIKKGTCVFPLLMSVLWDEDEWETPQNFNPQHFLDKQGRFVKRDAFMPFSAGRRVCPGESLARMELFLFFTSLLQRFRFTPPPGVSEDELDLTPAVGFTLNPTQHKLCAVNRL
ncbi:hypothetical protein cypCar_00047196 [Cyprinus carpio]|nr:hypothetical protein cypCar_00047196 [Cyprinus carpio]